MVSLSRIKQTIVYMMLHRPLPVRPGSANRTAKTPARQWSL